MPASGKYVADATKSVPYRAVRFDAICDPVSPKNKTHVSTLSRCSKPNKVAIIACMRKQLIILNTMVKNSAHWDENMI